MTLTDLEHIFKPQIDEGTTSLYYMLVDGDHSLIDRHSSDDLEGMLPCLGCYIYDGIHNRMPRFVK
jgi:hypothetical protein